MEEWLDSSEGYTNSFRRDNSAVELHEKYEGIDKSKIGKFVSRGFCVRARDVQASNGEGQFLSQFKTPLDKYSVI